MKRMFLILSTAALMTAGPTLASAQVRDHGPGWQRRAPHAGAYRSYAYRSYAYVPAPPRGYRADNPPGSSFQQRGIDEDLGRSPLNHGH